LNSEARTAWPLAAGARADVFRPLRVGPRGPFAGDGEPALELALRSAAVRVGFWLGWISIFVVATGLALDGAAKHRWLLVGLTLTAAAANTAAMLLPWQGGVRR